MNTSRSKYVLTWHLHPKCTICFVIVCNAAQKVRDISCLNTRRKHRGSIKNVVCRHRFVSQDKIRFLFSRISGSKYFWGTCIPKQDCNIQNSVQDSKTLQTEFYLKVFNTSMTFEIIFERSNVLLLFPKEQSFSSQQSRGTSIFLNRDMIFKSSHFRSILQTAKVSPEHIISNFC